MNDKTVEFQDFAGALLDEVETSDSIRKAQIARAIDLLGAAVVPEFQTVLLAMGKPGFENENRHSRTELENYAAFVLEKSE